MRTVIYGPPGTGKTTKLIGIMEEYLANGGKPNKICFTSFTRKSVDEAASRVLARFGYPRESLPFFRTIHSLCMGLSGLKNSDVVQFNHKKEIAKALGLELTTKRSIDGTTFGMKDGDKLFHLSDYYRCKKISLEQAWVENGQELSFMEVERFVKSYRQYKDSQLLVDFTDMLDRFIKEGFLPEIEIMFVDEAQDLSSLQWDAVFKLEKKAQRSYIAGDDDQSIYGWNGSNVETFIELDGNRQVLDTSHRLNKEVFDLAMEVVSRVDNRVDKKFTPKKDGGIVEEVAYLEDLPLNEGQWLLLARNGYMLKEYEDHCFERGLLYESAGYGPLKWPEMRALISYEAWRKTGQITEQDAQNIEQFISGSRELQWLTSAGEPQRAKPWFEVLDNISKERIEYLRSCKRNNEKFLDRPRITINTIHGVKGGEAENVCLMVDLAHTTWKNFDSNPDEEHRVFYVGVTRAIDNLYIKLPKTNKFYDL